MIWLMVDRFFSACFLVAVPASGVEIPWVQIGAGCIAVTVLCVLLVGLMGLGAPGARFRTYGPACPPRGDAPNGSGVAGLSNDFVPVCVSCVLVLGTRARLFRLANGFSSACVSGILVASAWCLISVPFRFPGVRSS